MTKKKMDNSINHTTRCFNNTLLEIHFSTRSFIYAVAKVFSQRTIFSNFFLLSLSLSRYSFHVTPISKVALLICNECTLPPPPSSLHPTNESSHKERAYIIT